MERLPGRAPNREEETSTDFGMALRDITPIVRRQLNLPSGRNGAVVASVTPFGPADESEAAGSRSRVSGAGSTGVKVGGRGHSGDHDGKRFAEVRVRGEAERGHRGAREGGRSETCVKERSWLGCVDFATRVPFVLFLDVRSHSPRSRRRYGLPLRRA